MEVEGLAAMLSDMLKNQNGFERTWKDIGGAHPWIEGTLAVMAEKKHLSDLFPLKTNNKEKKLQEIEASAFIRNCTTWERILLQNLNSTRYGEMFTLQIRLPSACYRGKVRWSGWGTHLPNRFHFAKLEDGFRLAGIHYPL